MTVCVQAAKALVTLYIWAGSSELSLLAHEKRCFKNISLFLMDIGNQMQNHKIETNSKLMHLIYFNFYQNYRQPYTVIPITTVRGPLEIFFFFATSLEVIYGPVFN